MKTNCKQKNFSFSFTIFLLLCVSIFTLCYMGVDSFVGDELVTLGFIRYDNSFRDLIHIFLTDEVTNPPLYDIFLYFWYRIVPHNEWWLLLPNVVFFVVGLVSLLGLALKKTMLPFSCIVIITIGYINPYTFGYLLYDLRSYSMLFMFSSLTFCYFFYMLEHESLHTRLLYGLILVFMCYTHYFGAITMAFYALLDLFLSIKSKKKLSWLVPYILVFCTLFPYLLMVFVNAGSRLGSFWPKNPEIKDILITFAQLSGNEFIFAVLLIAGICYFCSIVLNKKSIPFEMLTALYLIASTVICIFVYSKFINPASSLYVNHYFTAIKPQFLFVCAYIISYLLETIIQKYNLTVKNHFLSIELVLCITLLLASTFLSAKWYDRQLFRTPFTRYMAKAIKHDIETGTDAKEIAVYGYSGHYANGYADFYLSDDDQKGVSFFSSIEKIQNDYSKIYVFHDIYNDEEKRTELENTLPKYHFEITNSDVAYLKHD